MKQESTEKPKRVENKGSNVVLRFNIEETDNGYSYEYVIVKLGNWNYSGIVSAIVRSRYSQDDVEAIILNAGDKEHMAKYEELQEWRKFAKQLAKSVLCIEQ